MKTNESPLDRGIRALFAVVLIGVGLTLLTGALQIVALVVAGVLLFTAATGFCPLYRLFGIDTCRLSKSCAE